MAQFRMGCTWNQGDEWYILDNRVDRSYFWKVTGVTCAPLTGGMSYKMGLIDIQLGIETNRFLSDFSSVYVLTREDVELMCEKRKITPKFI